MPRGRALDVLPVKLRIASAEDWVLRKLEWFDKTDRTSPWPWRAELASRALDVAYLRHQAKERALADRLERALDEAHGAAS